jgi:endonuclease/exonuclease/phosphatase family metal-dependent hydrolase
MSSDTLRVMTYNILVGGKAVTKGNSRIPAIEEVIRNCDPDIVGIEEANDPDALRALAGRLGMECIIGYSRFGFHVALLSRWPILSWTNHSHPIFHKGCLEAEIAIAGEPLPWHIFVTHLCADFYSAYKAEHHRARELKVVIECMEYARSLGRPHVLVGDFNTLTSGEPFNVAGLIGQVVEYDEERQRLKAHLAGHPNLGYIIPRPLHPLMPLIRQIPKRPLLAGLTTFGVNLLLPRGAILPVQQAGYIDCLRAYHAATDIPPTCPLPRPAGRIDYIWADPQLSAKRLRGCDVIMDGPGCPVNDASDHRPVVAQFARVTASVESRSEAEELIGVGAGI